MNPENLFNLLPWDSEKFGFPVATIIPARLGSESLSEILGFLRQNGARLAYWASDSKHESSQEAASLNSGFLADRKVTYVRKLEGAAIKAGLVPGIEIMAGGEVTDEFRFLAYQSGKYSRFKVDPEIPPLVFEEIYKSWIERALDTGSGEEVILSRREGSVEGMITLQYLAGNLGRIGLLAVHPESRGKGLGELLVNSANDRFKSKKCQSSIVVTQVPNKDACTLYERCGFTREKIENFYHFWL